MLAKSRKVPCPTLSLFWTYFKRMGLFLFEGPYFLRSKNNANFTKCVFFNEAACTCVHMHKYFTSKVPIVW